MRDSPLEQMLARKTISRAEYEGGAKYRHHWYHAGMAGQIGSIDMDGVFASVPGARSGLAGGEQAAHHRRQYRLACDHLGMIASALVESVVCREIPLYSLAADYGWNSKSKGIEAVTGQLRSALCKLCDLWSIRSCLSG